MLQNAKYSVWFRTSEGEGHGVISLMDGDVSGGDNISSYTGTYVKDGDKFAATIAVKRHTQGQSSVFGIDNVDIALSGKSTPTTASCFWNRQTSSGHDLPSYPHPDRGLHGQLHEHHSSPAEKIRNSLEKS
jgi:hypothetical protein